MSKLIEEDVAVVGLRFRHKLEAREELAAQLRARDLPVELVREPENKYDPNAIMVVGAEDADEWAAIHLGYLGRETAEVLAPRFDAQELFTVDARLTSLDLPKFENGVVHVVLEDMR